MELVTISYPESRLEFFKEQLAAANRRLDWSMKHKSDWNDHSEKGEIVSYYEWAVQVAEKELENKPLTLDELKEMNLKPVWFQDRYGGWWDIFDHIVEMNNVKPYVLTAYGETFLVEDYGKTWNAYRYSKE